MPSRLLAILREAQDDLLPRDAWIDFAGPSVDAASEVEHIVEAGGAEEFTFDMTSRMRTAIKARFWQR